MKILVSLFALVLIAPQAAQAGAWTLAKGQVWSKITLMNQSTNEEYVSVGGAGRLPDLSTIYQPGDRARYRENGQYDSRAFFFDFFYGVTDRIDVGVQIPFFRQEFENIGFRAPNAASGFSDIRTFLKYRLFLNPAVGTIKLGFKAPTGDFQNQDGLIPVGEGQWDFDFIFQLGRSFWPLPGYANLDVGYRVRLKNDEIDRDPGNEWFFNAEVGYTPLKKLLLALKVEGIHGNPSRVFGLTLPRDVKRITYFSPTLLVGPHQNLSLEAALRISVGGRSFPAGKMWVAGISYSGNPFSR